MNPCERVPDELWLEILPQIPQKSLESVALTSRTLNRLSFPFRFSRFELCLLKTKPGGGLQHPSATEVHRTLQRLDFWCSEMVAPLVRTCKIAGSWASDFTEEGLYIIRNAFFERMLCFTGLEEVHAQHVPFTPQSIRDLCGLRTLTALYIEGCHLTAGEYLASLSQGLHLSQFTFSKRYRDADEALGWWISLLHPERLRVLEFSDPLHFLLKDFGCSVPSFPLVHSLSSGMDSREISQDLAALVKFPGVEVFRIHDRKMGELQSAPLVGVLPLLKEYTGPRTTVPLFLRTNLTHLAIHRCDPLTLIWQLRRVRIPTSLTTLDLAFDTFDNTLLATLFGLFPQLEALRIHAKVDNEIIPVRRIYITCSTSLGVDLPPPYFQVTPFFQTLADTCVVPTTLRTISLAIVYEWWFALPLAGDFPEPADLRDALVARCADLTSFWLDGEYFVFRWRKLSDGRIDEAIVDADDYVAVKEMRQDFNDFWETR
ncbi:hypothetical protein C8R43DRAFT_1135805 [Mycena crocata]|nr:hypothetical protein C8R43DRAFT_1135805 [Mycena crocata]